MPKLRVYHITNLKEEYLQVNSVEQAKNMIEMLASAELDDSSITYNVFGLEEYNEEEKEWQEWYDENGCNIDGEQW